jgi:hypothetical protein
VEYVFHGYDVASGPDRCLARECWMGNSLKDSGPADPATCDKPCGGDETQNCGGSMRLNLYKYSLASVGETTLDLGDAELDNAEIITRNGQLLV